MNEARCSAKAHPALCYEAVSSVIEVNEVNEVNGGFAVVGFGFPPTPLG